MENDNLGTGPARYRPTLFAKLHYLIWSLIILALWPVGWLFDKCGRMKKYD